MLRNLDLDLLRAFATVVESSSFSRAGERLLRGQSTISLQIKRLEDAVGRRLLERSSRSVAVTPEGARLLEFARRMISLNDEAVARINEPDVAGTVRLGTPEDFATSHLPEVLARFTQSHPRISLEVTCDLTLNLIEQFRQDQFDLVLVKREPSRRREGVRVWRERLMWVAGPNEALESETIPLVVSPAPCVYRKRAIDALEQTGRKWRICYTCGSLAGSLAAVRAGLGVTVLPKDMTPPGLRILETRRFPRLPDSEIALLTKAALSIPAARLGEHIIRSLELSA